MKGKIIDCDGKISEVVYENNGIQIRRIIKLTQEWEHNGWKCGTYELRRERHGGGYSEVLSAMRGLDKNDLVNLKNEIIRFVNYPDLEQETTKPQQNNAIKKSRFANIDVI